MSDWCTTHWTAILAAKGTSAEARSALDGLCEAYYSPVLNFLRRCVPDRDAEDLTHDFFLRVLQGEEFRHLQRDRGRFRSYLLGAVRFFLADVHEKQAARKRGAHERFVSLDAEIVDPASMDAEVRFDRDWAETLVAGVLAELRREAESNGWAATFEILRLWLGGDVSETDRQRALHALDVTPGHFKVLVSRLRKKFRTKMRSRIAETVSDDAEINAELDYLIRALR